VAARGIAVEFLHPGLVSTPMSGFTSSGISPETSVRGLLQRIEELTPTSSSQFRQAKGEELPWSSRRRWHPPSRS
jgi:hypothetical protein